MKVKVITLSKDKNSILVSGYGSCHSFDINDQLILETSLNEETMVLTVKLNGCEFTLYADPIKLALFNNVMRTYRKMKTPRFTPAPNWKFELEQIGYIPS